MTTVDKLISWPGENVPEAVDLLMGDGSMIVSPTKVGYVILATGPAGLARKFEAKNRNRNKPGVVIVGSLEQLHTLAELNPEIEELYRRHWEDDILLGCILPWRDEAKVALDQDLRSYVMDARETSCFVIKPGVPTELLARSLWEDHRRIVFASSANPSGQGNRGIVDGIGDRIYSSADLVIESDSYVRSIQPNATAETRYEQGVMVSMVDADGALVPVQDGARSVSPAPIVIRKGLDVDKIGLHLAEVFSSWDYRHGEYY